MTLSTEMEALPQQFSESLRILVVDHETTIHNAILERSIGLNYEVTTCSTASFALTLLREAKSCFDMILIEEQMSDMDSYDFLKEITQQINIPAIMVGVDGSKSTKMEAIENGACEYWIKPLSEDQINNMWQHVTRKVVNENKNDQILEILDAKGKKKLRRNDNGTKQTHVDVVEKDEPSRKKNRVSWTHELNQEFLRAINRFGLDNATPKKIHKVMNVPGLTRQSVGSHLQKIRLNIKKSTKVKQLKNEMSKSEGEKSKNDQHHFLIDTQLGLEAAKSTPEHDQNVLNSVIQCENNSHAQQHSPTNSNIFTNQSNLILEFLRVVNQFGLDNATPQKILEVMNIPGLTRESVANHLEKLKLDQYHFSSEKQLGLEAAKSMQEHDQNVSSSVIQCDNNSHTQQYSPTYANIYTNQTNMNPSTFDNIFTDESNMNLSTFDIILTDQSNMNQEFLWDVNQFGLDNATQNKILEEMNVPDLTKESVTSHLQNLRHTLKSSIEVTQLNNEMSKGDPWEKSKLDQYNFPNETQLDLEAAKSTTEHYQNLLNSVIQCDNNSHAQQHSLTYANFFTDHSNMNLSTFDNTFTNDSNMNLQTFDNILTDQSNMNLSTFDHIITN